MSARAGSDGSDSVWVKVEFTGMRAQETDGTFYIFDHVGEFPLGIQTIIDRNHKITLGTHLVCKHNCFSFVSVHPAAAMYISQSRPGSTQVGEVNIHFLKRSARGAIGYIG